MATIQQTGARPQRSLQVLPSRRGALSRCKAATNTPSPASKVYPKRLIEWLSDNGAPQEKAEIQTIVKEGTEIDITVASQPISKGDIALHIPEDLVVTLDRIFDGDGPLAELLTTNKLSEIAVLTLYLMYEKKRGPESSWFPLIKELDRIGGRGPQGAKSPLLWDAGQVEDLLGGSPIVAQIKERLKGIRKEYEELDTVWYLSGALFSNYPFEVPTEQFSVDRFIQAFTAVQSSIVHLQGVALSKRFALVPMGPPLMQYSSTCKALLQYNADNKQVQLVADRAYAVGEQLQAWCGPQPNSRLLLNYGIVDDNNPYDKLPLGVVIPSDDPLYREKRNKLAENELSTQQTFQMTRGTDTPLPENVLPYLRLVFASTTEELAAVKFGKEGKPVSDANEARVLAQLAGYLQKRLAGYKTTIQQDASTIANPCSGARQTVAARLLRIEKYILQGALEQVMAQSGAAQAIAKGAATGSGGVKFI
ncbi:hypothetical protein Ndes2437A_g07455 [Nannochloris sp. 'desiccata']